MNFSKHPPTPSCILCWRLLIIRQCGCSYRLFSSCKATSLLSAWKSSLLQPLLFSLLFSKPVSTLFKQEQLLLNVAQLTSCRWSLLDSAQLISTPTFCSLFVLPTSISLKELFYSWKVLEDNIWFVGLLAPLLPSPDPFKNFTLLVELDFFFFFFFFKWSS